MLFSYLGGAACALAAAVCAGGVEAGTGSDGRGGGQTPAGIVSVAIDSTELSAPPRFIRTPVSPEGKRASKQSQDLILVPLPAQFWATASGLTALALVGLWRRHRLRAEH